MTELYLVPAFGLPWLAFSLLVYALVFHPSRERGSLPLAVAFGFPLSALAMTATLVVIDAAGYPLSIAPGLLLSLLVAAGTVVRLRLAGRSPASAVPAVSRVSAGRWYALLAGLLLMLLALRFGSLIHEVVRLPTYPWDAWTTWIYRALLWFEQGELVEFVAPAAQPHLQPPETWQLAAWHYPAFVSLAATWGLLATGVKSDLAVGLPWLLCWFALLAGAYGTVVRLSGSWVAGVAVAYVLGSLPMLSTHAALAGYADLWITVILGLAVMGALLWIHTGQHRLAWVVLPAALALPFVKLEGMLWFLCLLPLAVVWVVSGRWLMVAALMGVAVLAWVSLGFNLYLPLPMDPGAIGLRDGLLHVPLVGTFAWEVMPGAWRPLVLNMFALANWHLLWFVAAIALIAGVYLGRHDRLIRATSAVLIPAVAVFYVMFFYSEAGAWSADFTATNRLLLHWSAVFVVHTWLVIEYMRNRTDLSARPGHAGVSA
ncbi:hypothetical protein [Thioalkalivibrio thiocyanodenitrificans]|uniref:hypothetical protein n=1 Tax=Thioalkalivibrio thiocyanodenitrificans TaxID=243063 RepID=UPI00036D6B72|nr:hypothetical protein [Thioalkalivibrio thiocyanodenitrificans]